MSPELRVIAHADMDAFFAAVEQLDDPTLRGRPLIVGYPGARGVVCTASYEARKFGVGSAMAMVRAAKLCPQAIIVPPRFSRYEEISHQVNEVFRSFTPKLEPLSLDEAFLDLTGTERLLGSPEALGRRLKASVFDAVGLTVSVGISQTKFVAKVASDFKKPDGLTVVAPGEERAFLAPLPVRRLWGVGPKTADRLASLRLSTIGELAHASPELLRSAMGQQGAVLQALARGIDPREVVVEREPVSIGAEETFAHDLFGADALLVPLRTLADSLGARLRKAEHEASGVRVKVKTASFQLRTRQRQLAQPTDTGAVLFAAARELLDEFSFDEPVRLVGIAGFGLRPRGVPRQQDLFTPASSDPKSARLERSLDEIRERYGAQAIRRAEEE